mmetsp:Transcript_15028/g.38139  ORF Transcript_15028/g.38139 Transcript_15028/m.38139 type:complete len:247 (-) Transcript_15028:1218-1958(-)
MTAMGMAMKVPNKQPTMPCARAQLSGTLIKSDRIMSSCTTMPTNPTKRPEIGPGMRTMSHGRNALRPRTAMPAPTRSMFVPSSDMSALDWKTAATSELTLSLVVPHQSLSSKRARCDSPCISNSEASQLSDCLGSHFSKCSTAAPTPSSFSMEAAISCALATHSAEASVTNLAASVFPLSSPMGVGRGPTPARCTTSPQKNWSPKKGQTSVGLPARSPAAVVPAPPWWTTAETCGNSQSCGAGPIS